MFTMSTRRTLKMYILFHFFALENNSSLGVTTTTAYDNIETLTHSHPDAFPSALQQKRKTQTKIHSQGDQGTLVWAFFHRKNKILIQHLIHTKRYKRNALDVDILRHIQKNCR